MRLPSSTFRWSTRWSYLSSLWIKFLSVTVQMKLMSALSEGAEFSFSNFTKQNELSRNPFNVGLID